MVVPLCITPFPVIIQVPKETEVAEDEEQGTNQNLGAASSLGPSISPALLGSSPERKLVIVEGSWR